MADRSKETRKFEPDRIRPNRGEDEPCTGLVEVPFGLGMDIRAKKNHENFRKIFRKVEHSLGRSSRKTDPVFPWGFSKSVDFSAESRHTVGDKSAENGQNPTFWDRISACGNPKMTSFSAKIASFYGTKNSKKRLVEFLYSFLPLVPRRVLEPTLLAEVGRGVKFPVIPPVKVRGPTFVVGSIPFYLTNRTIKN